MRWSPWVGLLLIGSACGNEFTPYEEIDAPRVLALRASEPEIQFGETTTLDALVTEPPTSYAWSWCPFVASAVGAYECLVTEAQVGEVLGPQVSFDLGANATADLRDFAQSEDLERLCAKLLTIDLPSDTVQPACDGGLDVSVRLVLRWGEHEIVSLRDVRFSWLPLDEATRRRNPETPLLFARRNDVLEPLDGSVTVPHDTDVDFVANITDDTKQLLDQLVHHHRRPRSTA